MGFDEQTFEKLLKSCRYRNVPSTPPESQTNGSLDSLEAMMALSKSRISFSNGWFSGSCIIEDYIVALAWVLPPRIASLQLKVRKGKFEHQEAFLVVPAFLASANFSRFFWSPNTQHSEVWQIPSKNSGEDWRSTKALRLTEIRKTRFKKKCPSHGPKIKTYQNPSNPLWLIWFCPPTSVQLPLLAWQLVTNEGSIKGFPKTLGLHLDSLPTAGRSCNSRSQPLTTGMDESNWKGRPSFPADETG